MDTDDFSEMAWDIIARAAEVSDTLKVELGALSRNYRTEDDWLRGVQGHLQEIAEDPGAYLDFWDLEENEGVTAAILKERASELCRQVDAILVLPANARGNRGYE